MCIVKTILMARKELSLFLSLSLCSSPYLEILIQTAHMAEKTSTLILKVDLECHLCYKKIRRVLCKLQDRENIRVIAYDEKNNSVTLIGPFDPHHLSKKLQCKACKVIKDIQIKDNAPKEKPNDSKPTSPPEKKKEKEVDKPKVVEPAKPAPKPAPPKSEPDPPKPEPSSLKPEPEPPKPKADPPKPEPVVPAPDLVYSPDPPAWPAGPVCGCRPYCEGYWGCSNCGSAYGWVGPPDPYRCPYPHMYGKTCQFFCEEDRTCRIM